MRLSGFTRTGALIGFFGALAIMLISAVQFDSDEVSRKDVIMAEILFGLPIFTVVGAGLGAGWDFFEKRKADHISPEEDMAEPESDMTLAALANPPRKRRRNPPGGRRQR
jgi:hypothetical protein